MPVARALSGILVLLAFILGVRHGVELLRSTAAQAQENPAYSSGSGYDPDAWLHILSRGHPSAFFSDVLRRQHDIGDGTALPRRGAEQGRQPPGSSSRTAVLILVAAHAVPWLSL